MDLNLATSNGLLSSPVIDFVAQAEVQVGASSVLLSYFFKGNCTESEMQDSLA